jgi:Luciferase-like monooxygenase
MEFGLFHEFQDTSEAEAFSQSFALVNAAEQWGLDANFAPDRWVLASPLILAAAIAQRTRRMKTLEIVKTGLDRGALLVPRKIFCARQSGIGAEATPEAIHIRRSASLPRASIPMPRSASWVMPSSTPP